MTDVFPSNPQDEADDVPVAARNLPEMPIYRYSTTVNRSSAIRRWNEFFAPEAHCPKLEEFTAHKLTKHVDLTRRPNVQVLFLKYCHFILRTPKKVNSDNSPTSFYKHGTLKQWLSGAYTFLKERFPELPVLQKEHPQGRWYSQIWESLQKEHDRFAFNRGELTDAVVQGIRRDLLVEIVETIAMNGTVHSVKLTLITLILYFFCGRAGELGLLTLTKLFWLDGAPFLAFPNPKTNREQMLDIYPHYNNPLLDIFYWLSSHLLVSSYDFQVGNEMAWIFKDLRERYGPTDQPFAATTTSRDIPWDISYHLQRLVSEQIGFALTSHMFWHGSGTTWSSHRARVTIAAFFSEQSSVEDGILAKNVNFSTTCSRDSLLPRPANLLQNTRTQRCKLPCPL